jgi:hypothetical protein
MVRRRLPPALESFLMHQRLGPKLRRGPGPA